MTRPADFYINAALMKDMNAGSHQKTNRLERRVISHTKRKKNILSIVRFQELVDELVQGLFEYLVGGIITRNVFGRLRERESAYES